MRNRKYHIDLTNEERKLIIKAIIDERNSLIQAGRYTDAVDDLLLKVMKARLKRGLLS